MGNKISRSQITQAINNIESSKPVIITDGNWSSAITSNIGANDSGKYLYPIGFNVGSPDPAPKCDKKTFYATYKCGNDTVVKNIPVILNAVGKQAKFDCTSLFNTCNGTTLHLGDDGILRMYNNSQSEKVWDSTQAPTNATPLSLNMIVALDAYKPRNNPAPFKNRSHLKSGEFLEVGQFIGSPNGTCRLEMVVDSTSQSANNIWTPVSSPFTTTETNSVVRVGTPGFVEIKIPRIGTSVTTNNSYDQIETTITKDQSWIVIGEGLQRVTVPDNSTVRYGANNFYVTKKYTKSITILLPGPQTAQNSSDDLLTFTKVGSENSSITPPDGKPTIYRYGKEGRMWVYRTFSTTFTANTDTFGANVFFNTADGITKDVEVTYDVPGDSPGNPPNRLELMINTSAISKSLQVVYNVEGCTDTEPVNKDSSTLYTIPWTNRQNLGKMGYINENGQLKNYDSSITTNGYSSTFKLLANADGTTYGMYGNNLGSPIPNVEDEMSCQQKCQQYGYVDGQPPESGSVNTCMGFEYEKIGKTCQLKDSGIITGGIRYNNPQDNSVNYEYYSRVKNVSGLDTSCTSSVTSGNVTDWDKFTVTDNMSSTVKCGLTNAVSSERDAVATANASLNSMTGLFSNTINTLYEKYEVLKNKLLDNKTKLDSNFNKLNESKQDLADWSGEQSEQLDAMNEERDLNMMSQNYKHIMWSILAIMIIIGIIKFTKSFDVAKTLDIAKSVDIPKIPSAATAATAATATAATSK
jgi:hypothetical protein